MCDTCSDSRRNFLKQGMGALAGALFLPAWGQASSDHGGGHGTPEHAPPKKSAPPKEKKAAESHAPAAADPHGPPHAAAHASPSQKVTPDEALARLLEGNKRFVNNKMFHPNESEERRTEIANGQSPFAIILGCADSRIPPEIVFDHGLGDLFVVRVAGNLVDDAGVGSFEYAVAHLGTPLIVVLGHERCGAVKATLELMESGDEAPGKIGALVTKIRPAAEKSAKEPGDKVVNAIKMHARMQAAELMGLEPILKEKIEDGKLKVVAAYYDLDTGVVEIL